MTQCADFTPEDHSQGLPLALIFSETSEVSTASLFGSVSSMASLLGQAVWAANDTSDNTLISCFGLESTESLLGQAIAEHPDATYAFDLAEADEIRAYYGLLAVAFPRPATKLEKGSNLTTQWIGQNYTEINQMLVKHLNFKLRTSRKVSLIEDHVQVFLIRLMERDHLAPHLEAGKVPSYNVLRFWAYQSACTEMRGWGVDADMRSARGAKTNRDRKREQDGLPAIAVHSDDSVVERHYQIENGDFVGELYNPKARNAEIDLISSEILDQARALVRRKFARTNPHCETVFNAMLEGDKQYDIAEAAGITRSQASVLISQIREVLRKGLPMIQA